MTAHATPIAGIGRLAGRRSRQLSRAGILLYALAATCGAVGQALLGELTFGTIALFAGQALQWLAFASFIASYVVWFRRKRAPGTLMVNDGMLHVERHGLSLHRPLRDVESAFPVMHELPAPPTVEILFRGGDELSCDMADAESARALTSALGFGPGQRRIRIPFATPRRRLLHPLLGLVTTWVTGVISMVPLMLFVMRATDADRGTAMGARAAVSALISLVAIFAIYPLLKRIARAPELTIADDGIVYTAGRKSRFVPRERLRGVEQAHPRMAATIHTDGETIMIMGTGIDVDRRAAAAWLLHERLQAPMPVNAPHFGRGGRSIVEWREHLRRAMDPGYRAAGTSAEDAEATLRSAAATDEQKVGAAIALRVAGVEPARIRIAAEGTAYDPVREAITAIADDATDDVVERKLARIAPR